MPQSLNHGCEFEQKHRTSIDSITKVNEGVIMIEATKTATDKVAPTTTAASNDKAANLSQQVFSDPRDFLKTIQDNFKEMSNGHSVITESDLKSDMKLGSTDQVRAAATIAELHFSDLADLSGDDRNTSGISKEDMQYATDMNNHNITGLAITNAVIDASMSAGGFVAGAIGLTAGIDQFAIGGAAIAGSAAIVPTVAIGIGVMGVGVGVLGAYTAYKEYGNLSKDSYADRAKYKSWM
jgi:hypothetical protein